MSITITERVPLGIDETDLCAWIGAAAPGDVLVYYRGSLSVRLAEREGAELARVARRAWWASERGLIHLVQRRHAPDDYSYCAVARTKPQSAPVSLSSLLFAEFA